MKRMFSILLIFCTAFAFAENDSIFEETDEKVPFCATIPFAAEEEIFEEDEEPEKIGIDNLQGTDRQEKTKRKASKQTDLPKKSRAFKANAQASCRLPTLCTPRNRTSNSQASYMSWGRFKANFGMEKLFIRFPQKPAISQTSTMLTAYAYDNAVLYSLVGYYPPIGQVDPICWFDSVLDPVDHYPFTLISQVIFQASNGDWVMDYVSHDYVQNLIIKARAIVTPFNAYTLQCVKPNGMRDYFDYYLDNFFIKSGCP